MARTGFLFDLVSKEQVLQKLFDDADEKNTGELDAEQLQVVHASIRPGGVSIRQTQASISEICAAETCDIYEFFDVLNEMDRRFFLVKDLQWEFAMLDGKQSGTIAEKDARFLFQAVYDEFFSHRRWLEFLKARRVPGSGVSFAEIEVELCDIPSSEWLEQDARDEERERGELLKAQQAKFHDEDEKLKKAQELKQKEKEAEENRLRKEKEKNEQRRKQLKQKEDEKINKEKKKAQEEERRRREEAARRKEEEYRLKAEEEMMREEEEMQRLMAEELRKREEQEASHKWKKEELLRQQEEERERLERERAERELLENAEADQAEEMADVAAEAEEEAVEAAKLAAEAVRQAQDEESRKAAQEAEKKALAEAQANKEKKLRASLKAAQKSRKLERLDNSIKQAKEAKMPSLKKPIEDADKTRFEVQLGKNLKEACQGRSLERLEKAIKDVKKAGLEEVYSVELNEAERLANRLRRLERIRQEILELNQSTISEIRRYQSPPPAVHQVMIATYLLLGYKEKPLKTWKNMQAVLGKTGKEGLKRQVTSLDPVSVSDSVADYTEATYLKEHQLDTIRDVSAGAATFYAWATNMIEEARACVEQRAKLAEEEAERKAEEEEEKRKAQEKEKERQESRKRRQQQRESQRKTQRTSVTDQGRHRSGSQGLETTRKTSREVSPALSPVRRKESQADNAGTSGLQASRKDARSREVSPAMSPTRRKTSQNQKPGESRKKSDQSQGLHVSRKESRSRDVSPVKSQPSRKDSERQAKT